jgi:hypothetical protein
MERTISLPMDHSMKSRVIKYTPFFSVRILAVMQLFIRLSTFFTLLRAKCGILATFSETPRCEYREMLTMYPTSFFFHGEFSEAHKTSQVKSFQHGSIVCTKVYRTKRFRHGQIYHAEMVEDGKAVLWKKYGDETTAIKVESTSSPTIKILNCLSIRSLSVN